MSYFKKFLLFVVVVVGSRAWAAKSWQHPVLRDYDSCMAYTNGKEPFNLGDRSPAILATAPDWAVYQVGEIFYCKDRKEICLPSHLIWRDCFMVWKCEALDALFLLSASSMSGGTAREIKMWNQAVVIDYAKRKAYTNGEKPYRIGFKNAPDWFLNLKGKACRYSDTVYIYVSSDCTGPVLWECEDLDMLFLLSPEGESAFKVERVE